MWGRSVCPGGPLLPLLAALCVCARAGTRPHIVLIVADDLGWNDVGFHGMNHIPTPNVDALAASGLVLQRHYVTPLCSPSRAALLTGRYPIHTGMQHGVLYGAEPAGLPLTERLLPEYLRALGYRTHLVGKWHLGSYKKEYLPLNRGFDSHVGFWTGKIDMYDHTNMEQGSWGFDFRRGFKTAHDLFGKYATDVYTEEAVKLIRAHNSSEPLFLMVAHSAVHSGNPYEPIRAPPALIDSFAHINDTNRQRFAGVLSRLDWSVGEVVAALAGAGLLDRCVLLLTTDNGGPPAGFNDNAASNYPLRGTKNTLWEGGTRGAAVLWASGGLLQNRSLVSHARVHLVDWLPTLYRAAGGDQGDLPATLDGVSLWDALSRSLPSPREEMATLLNIDPVDHTAALLKGDWKLLNGTTYGGSWDGWYGPAGREGTYSEQRVYSSPAGRALGSRGLMPASDVLRRARAAATVSCGGAPGAGCRPLEAPCLFNVRDDPCERRNLALQEPALVSELQAALARWRRSAAPPVATPVVPAGDPQRWGRVFTNFGDYSPAVGAQDLYI